MKTTRGMQKLIGLAWLAGAIALPTLKALTPAKPPEPKTEIVFFEPEKFSDVRDSYLGSDRGRDAILEELKSYLKQRAQIYVPEGQKLSITITDVDLAGDFEPWRGANAQDIRIVKDIYPPRINLSFKLTQTNGEVVKAGNRELRDLNFMFNAMRSSIDSLRYEKALIDDWLRSEFGRDRKT